MILTETHIIKKKSKTQKLYDVIDDYCYKSKNLRNYTNYLITQCSRISYKLRNGEILDSWEKKLIYEVNCGIAKYNQGRKDKIPIKYIDNQNGYIADAYFLSWYLKAKDVYKAMPYATCAQICIQNLCKDWKAYYKGLKAYTTKSKTMLGKPRKPGYYDKDRGRNWFVLTSQNITECENGVITFPSFLCDLHMKARHKGIRQVRIITKWNKIVVQFMYSEDIKVAKVKSERVMGIDLGLNNLATVVSNTEMTPYIINGRTLKSINQYYNKEVARLRKEAKISNNVYDTKRMCRIVEKRNNKVKDYLYKASRQIISIALENEIGTIIVGNNKGWKQEVGLGKKVNQNFVSIPYAKLIEMIRYKAELKGIAVKVVEESYTSGTSYLDNEKPIARYYNKGRRKHRGMFESNEGYEINADVNGAYQIMKKDGVSAPIKNGEKVVRLKVA